MTSRGAIREAGFAVAAGLALWLAGIVFLACDSAPSRPTNRVAQAAVAPAVPTPPPAQAAAPRTPQGPELEESDFVEDDANRDPFRTYLAEFLTPQRRTAKIQRKVLFPRYGLDELQLIAVVAGRVRSVAMFRDPQGLGVTVKRGDHISKNSGKVKQILPDGVVVQIEEQTDSGQTMADRVISLHPQGENQSSRRR